MVRAAEYRFFYCYSKCLHFKFIVIQLLKAPYCLTFTEESYCNLCYMALYTFLHNLLNVLLQIENNMRLRTTTLFFNAKLVNELVNMDETK
jgi:hypothetical protein